jgi:putative ATP-dependent endonuclease of OLD family
MYIESLVLQNFRCFGNQRTVIPLEPGLTPFIGSNGAGKTAACQALQRLFGITNDERSVRVDDFHVPPGATAPGGETGASPPRTLAIEAILAFPELCDDGDQGKDAVPEFFHRMAADDQGTLKCRIVLEARWEADGTIDGGVSENRWAVNTLEETYGEENRTVLPGAERARIQVVYVPATRDGARQLTAFLRGRLWRAAQWSDELRQLVAASAAQVSGKFHDEAATSTVERALSERWQELHGAGTHSIPRFQPIAPDVAQMLRDTELRFEPDHGGESRPARLLSDGQRSLLHLALTTAALDIETRVASGSLAGEFDMTSAHLPTLTVLIIEEPENSLAPFYLSRIVSQILQVCGGPRAQAVLVSHSASVLSRIDPASIRHFRLDAAAGTAAVRPITLPDDATEAGKYVREAVRAHPELYFARFVVLGEGDTEELVIPAIARARGIALDPSFVATVPLGGRHTNHFWKLLTDLDIPFATLLDFDYGRADAGPARLGDACRRLAENGVDVFAGLEGFSTAADLTDAMTAEQMVDVMLHLRRFGVFFAVPLDLDMAMLDSFWKAYTELDPGERGPYEIDATDAVLGSGGSPGGIWAPADPDTFARQQERLRWYRYLFLGRSKPSTHLRALARLSSAELKDGPAEVCALIDYIKTKLGL